MPQLERQQLNDLLSAVIPARQGFINHKMLHISTQLQY